MTSSVTRTYYTQNLSRERLSFEGTKKTLKSGRNYVKSVVEEGLKGFFPEFCQTIQVIVCDLFALICAFNESMRNPSKANLISLAKWGFNLVIAGSFRIVTLFMGIVAPVLRHLADDLHFGKTGLPLFQPGSKLWLCEQVLLGR